MRKDPTASQKSILEFLEERNADGETPPTYREICQRFGYRSTKAAADHIAALEKKGLIIREKGRSRGLRLARGTTGIPVLGQIPAGSPREALPMAERQLAIDPIQFGIRDRCNAFALRVTGDSMIGRQIRDGDIVLLESGPIPQNGDIVAALIDNESTLKTFVRKEGRIWLRAENPLYPDLIPTMDLNIQGVARAVIRNLNI
jgi:repressor LexA